jgi:hypothetical protein
MLRKLELPHRLLTVCFLILTSKVTLPLSLDSWTPLTLTPWESDVALARFLPPIDRKKADRLLQPRQTLLVLCHSRAPSL